MQAIYILDGSDIVNGRKQAIVTPKPRDITGTQVLLTKTDEGCKLAGVITIGQPEELPLDAFDSKQEVHGVSIADRRRWWPENETLFLYPIVTFAPFREAVPVPLPAGTGMKTTTTECSINTEQLVILSRQKLDNGQYLYTYGYI
jgi:hypothetical protein